MASIIIISAVVVRIVAKKLIIAGHSLYSSTRYRCVSGLPDIPLTAGYLFAAAAAAAVK